MTPDRFTCKRDPAKLDLALMCEARIIAIDGDNGAGKTCLANELSRILNGTHIEIDQYLAKDGRPYVEQLDKTGLLKRIEVSVDYPLVLDGVLILDVLDAISTKTDYLIFCKAFFLGERTLDRYLPPTSALPRSKLTREIAMYYRRRKPWLEANHCYSLHHDISGTTTQSL